MAANKRITDTTLPNTFKQDGEVLYGSDLNQVITILKGGINANKADLDKLLSSYTGARVVYSVAALNDHPAVDGDKGFVYNPEELGDGILVYIHNGVTWVLSHELSLEKLYQDILDVYEVISSLEGVIEAKKQIYFEGDDLTDIKTGDMFVEIE